MFQQLSLKRWSTVTPQDEPLYGLYFTRSTDPFSYENNWAFITQEVRVGGLKLEDHGMLLTAVVKAHDSPFIFILPPCGDTRDFGAHIVGTAAELVKDSGKRVVLRKLPTELCERVVQTSKFTVLPASAFGHPRDVPEDQFPQVVIDVPATLEMYGSRYRRMRNDLRYFEGQCRPEVLDLHPLNCQEVTEFVHAWCREYNFRHGSGSGADEAVIIDPTAYSILAEQFASAIDNNNYFAKLVRVGGRLAAFTLAGRSGADCAAQYANLSLLRVRGCSEFLLFELLRELWRADISYLNLGGAETEGQFQFKKKFDVRLIKESFEVEYTP